MWGGSRASRGAGGGDRRRRLLCPSCLPQGRQEMQSRSRHATWCSAQQMNRTGNRDPHRWRAAGEERGAPVSALAGPLTPWGCVAGSKCSCFTAECAVGPYGTSFFPHSVTKIKTRDRQIYAFQWTCTQYTEESSKMNRVDRWVLMQFHRSKWNINFQWKGRI